MSQINQLYPNDFDANVDLADGSKVKAEITQLVTESNAQDTRLTNIESNALTIGGLKSFSNGIKTNTIDEVTSTVGVTIDSVLCKDGMVTVAGTPTTGGQIGYASNSLTHHNGTGVATIETTLNQGFIILQDQKASGTDGGTFTSAAWRTRDLNTEVVDTGNHCTLAANQFTLVAGTYRIQAGASGYAVGGHKLRLQNITDAATTLVGNNTVSTATGASTNNTAQLFGRFTIAASKTFELQHQCGTTKTTNGFGLAHSFASTSEIYTTIIIEKEAA